MTDRELMQQALSTLEGWANHGEWVWPESALEQAKRNTTESIAALRERLAQPEQGPVAWMHPSWIDPDTRGWESDSFNAIPIEGWVPLYTAPRQWQGLTDDEITKAGHLNVEGERMLPYSFARAIETRLKEKNT